jgi:hypothetical protein
MAGSNPGREPGRESVKVVLPGEPPALTTLAAQALLRILVKAWEKQEGDACEALGAPETPDR